jgi:hypothetical protein
MNGPRSTAGALLFMVASLVAGLGCQPPPTLFLGADAGARGVEPTVVAPDAQVSAPQPDAVPSPADMSASADASAPGEPPSEPAPGEDSVPTEIVPGVWSPPSFCHDLAPAAGIVEATFFAGVCPSARDVHGGQILDGIYREVRRQICMSTPGTFATQPVRIRISAGGMRIEWSADQPVFSAWISTSGTTISFNETCRVSVGGELPRYLEQFSASGDELTLYTGLSAMTFRREP